MLDMGSTVPGHTLATPPFAAADELNHDLVGKIVSRLNDGRTEVNFSGNPAVSIDWGISKYLEDELCTPDLDRFGHKYLWLITTQSSDHISALHEQLVKGRKVVIAESPKLHLVWIYDRVFLKPIPPYLLSHGFWEQYLLPSNLRPHPLGDHHENILRSALGYLRTYHYLIQHPSDFKIALEYNLIPEGTEFETFCSFTRNFKDLIQDQDVSKRYHYGEIRLTRLNFWSKIVLGRWHYHKVHRQYGSYFERFYGPLLFLFGSLSVALSAIQVEMSVESLEVMKWTSFWKFSRYFSVLSLVVVALLSMFLVGLLVGKWATELRFAFKDKRRLVKSHKTSA